MKSLVFEELGINDNDVKVHGYSILIKAPVLPEKTKSGIWRPDEYTNREEKTYYVGLVVKMGQGCYLPEEKYGYRWCEVGDWIIYSSYEREGIKFNGHQCYLINDERVKITVSSPEIAIESLRS